MQKITVRADRQVTSLLDFAFWSNVVVVLAVITINIINFLRMSSGQPAFVTAVAPEMFVMISFALALYLGFKCLTTRATKKRLSAVFVTLDDAGISGLCLPNPTSSKEGETFMVTYGEIRTVSVEDVAVTKKHVAPSLKLETAERTYIVPAPEGINELIRLIADQMTAN
ncbi:MAG: hypothetical protein C0413_03765 [Clostridiales bacterium]|nr:hypothetical protein [Clostridiales bacterium]